MNSPESSPRTSARKRYGRWLLMLLALTIAATPSLASARPTWGSDHDLYVRLMDSGVTTRLDGMELSGEVAISVEPTRKISRVLFYLDDRLAEGLPHSIDNAKPYLLSGGTLDAGTLGGGAHTLTAVVELSGRRSGSRTLSATFTVADAPAPQPSPAPAIELSTSTLYFSALERESVAPQNVGVVADDGSSSTYTATANVDWLGIAGDGTFPGDLQVQVDSASLTVGTYTGSLTLSASGYDDTVLAVSVEVGVAATAPGSRIHWGGDDWYLHGVNVAWYQWGCDFGCGTGSGVRSADSQAALRDRFGQLQQADIHVARWWVFPGNPWQVTRDGSGAPQSIHEAAIADFDAALELAEEFDLYYVFTLFSAPSELPAAWLSDPTQRQQLADVLGDLFARYANNPRVLTWQVFNEPEWDIWNDRADIVQVQELVRAVGASVHSRSSAQVSVGSAMLGGLWMWQGLGLDYYTAHWYDYMSSGGWCAMCTDYAEVQQRFDLDGPLVIGEFFSSTGDDALERFEAWYQKGYAGAWAWSLFPERTYDGMAIDLAAAAAFSARHGDVGPP